MQSKDTECDNMVKQVATILCKPKAYDQLSALSKEEAQCTLDFLQDLLDIPYLPAPYKQTFLKVSLKLSRMHSCVPRCLTLSGFKKREGYPFAQGHFGDVWRGWIGRIEVAVKQARVFDINHDNHNKVIQRVIREAMIWRQCDHPNILPFFGVFQDPIIPSYCLVSPFMANGSLPRFLNNTKCPDRYKLALDITQGMLYLHRLGIIHGDLKGENILITEDYRAVITDFGISCVMDVALTSSSRTGGTIRWQAPEVLMSSQNSFPGDVYSLACVYFEVFNESIPWKDINDGAVVLNVVILRQHPPYPRFLESTELGGLWWRLMTRCWTANAQDRPTLPTIMAILHTRDQTSPEWGLRRLRGALIQGEIRVPSGLPRFLSPVGSRTTPLVQDCGSAGASRS
ncbi:kinase-like protein [Armillaria solidipes]|uniref:Kinase-like protein n=1 Tax=Armillaria solidipes TaxID=1076256 RepID=A0A2H3BI72_9AGAR|nr:kinase-like protein [Armillaria solidipes]